VQLGVVGQNHAGYGPVGQVLDVQFFHRQLMPGVAQQQVVAAMQRAVFNGLGQFAVELVGDVGLQQPDNLAAFGHDFLILAPDGDVRSDSRMNYQCSRRHQGLKRFAEGRSRDFKPLGKYPFRGQEVARRIHSVFQPQG